MKNETCVPTKQQKNSIIYEKMSFSKSSSSLLQHSGLLQENVITDFLDIEEVMKMCQTSKKMHRTCASGDFWVKRILLDFGVQVNMPLHLTDDQEYRFATQAYKDAYLQHLPNEVLQIVNTLKQVIRSLPDDTSEAQFEAITDEHVERICSLFQRSIRLFGATMKTFTGIIKAIVSNLFQLSILNFDTPKLVNFIVDMIDSGLPFEQLKEEVDALVASVQHVSRYHLSLWIKVYQTVMSKKQPNDI